VITTFLNRLRARKQFFRRAFSNFVWLGSRATNQLVAKHLGLVEVRHSGQINHDGKFLVLICMSRDEKELLQLWIKHHSRLIEVGAIVLIDHCSMESIRLTDFFLSKSISYYQYRFDYNSHLQAHVLNQVSRQLAHRYPNAVFLPLDTDEFLPDVEARTIIASKIEIGYLKWRLVYPVELFSSEHVGQRFPSFENVMVMPRCFGGNKHFVLARKIRLGARWSQGAHVAYNCLGFPLKGNCLGSIIHIPVQSSKQIYAKLLRGTSVHDHPALDMRDSKGDRIIGNHWFVNGLSSQSNKNFLEESLLKYYDGALVGQRQFLWQDLISGQIQ